MKSYIVIFKEKKSAEAAEKKLLTHVRKRGNKSEAYSEITEDNGEFGITVLDQDMEVLTDQEKAKTEIKTHDSRFNKIEINE